MEITEFEENIRRLMGNRIKEGDRIIQTIDGDPYWFCYSKYDHSYGKSNKDDNYKLTMNGQMSTIHNWLEIAIL